MFLFTSSKTLVSSHDKRTKWPRSNHGKSTWHNFRFFSLSSCCNLSGKDNKLYSLFPSNPRRHKTAERKNVINLLSITKDKDILVHIMNANGKMEILLHSSLASNLNEVVQSALTFWPLYSLGNSPRYPLNWRLGSEPFYMSWRWKELHYRSGNRDIYPPFLLYIIINQQDAAVRSQFYFTAE